MTAILSVRDLRKQFSERRGWGRRASEPVRAVDGVSFDIAQGETFGLVGESGCGKTTLSRMLLRLIEPDGGQIHFEGKDALASSGDQLRTFRRRMQLVFQDPTGSLNPRMLVRAIISEPLVVHGIGDRRQQRRRVDEVLERVGLSAPDGDRYPHEFSGGQRQRIGIARALAPEPVLLICDEPVSALDVSIQSQILNLLRDLKEELGLSMLFIAHDLGVVRHVSDRVGVMRGGQLVEIGEVAQIFTSPAHDYTKALLVAAGSAASMPTDKLVGGRSSV